MEKKKGKRIEATVNQLPEPIIQHIQSFLNRKDAARTTLLSKPWYTAWLTRPSLDFDQFKYDFDKPLRESSGSEEFMTKTMQRYQGLNLKIDSFRLRINIFFPQLLAHNLIVNAIKIGATDLELDLPLFIFSREVLESESIIRLSLGGCEINENCVACCSKLNSLSLDRVIMRSDDVFWNIITSCSASIEELSLSSLRRMLMFSRENPYELHKLKRLFLRGVLVDNTFFSDFASRFPCLKDLSLLDCIGYTRIVMTSTSLERIMLLEQPKRRLMDKFDVPNIRKFTYSGDGVPSLSIEVSSTREWEFDISVRCHRFPGASWLQSMKRLLKKMRLSTITISLSLFHCSQSEIKQDEVNNNFGVVTKRVAVETIAATSEFCSATLLRLLGICCPKFITHFWHPEWSTSFAAWNESLDMLCNVLSANQNTFGLNEVKVEIYEEIHKDEWRPLVLKGPLDALKPPVNKCKVRFRLTWG